MLKRNDRDPATGDEGVTEETKTFRDMLDGVIQGNMYDYDELIERLEDFFESDERSISANPHMTLCYEALNKLIDNPKYAMKYDVIRLCGRIVGSLSVNGKNKLPGITLLEKILKKEGKKLTKKEDIKTVGQAVTSCIGWTDDIVDVCVTYPEAGFRAYVSLFKKAAASVVAPVVLDDCIDFLKNDMSVMKDEPNDKRKTSMAVRVCLISLFEKSKDAKTAARATRVVKEFMETHPDMFTAEPQDGEAPVFATVRKYLPQG